MEGMRSPPRSPTRKAKGPSAVARAGATVKIPNNLTKADLVNVIEDKLREIKALDLKNETVSRENRLLRGRFEKSERQYDKLQDDIRLASRLTPVSKRPASVIGKLRNIAGTGTGVGNRGNLQRGSLTSLSSGTSSTSISNAFAALSASEQVGRPKKKTAAGELAIDAVEGHLSVANAIADLARDDIRSKTLVLLQSLTKFRNTMIASRQIQRGALDDYVWVYDRLQEDIFGLVECDQVMVLVHDVKNDRFYLHIPEDALFGNGSNPSFTTQYRTRRAAVDEAPSIKSFEDSTVSHALRLKQTVVAEVNDKTPQRGDNWVRMAGERSVMCSPIFGVINGARQVLAVVRVASRQANAFRFDDRSVMDALMLTIGSYVSQVRSNNNIASVQFRINALLRVVSTVSTEHETDRIISRIIEVAYEVLKADRVTMFVMDEDGQNLVGFVSQDATGFSIPLGKGIAGSVALTGVDVVIEDVYEHEKFDRGFDLKTNFRTRSMLCAAVKDPNGRCSGVVQAINKQDSKGVFTYDDKQVMRFIADNAGMTLYKAHLMREAERERRKSEALVEVVKAVNSSDGDPDKLVDNLVAVAYRIVECERVTLFILDEVRGDLVATVSKDAGGFRIPVGQGIAGYVAESGVTVNIPDAYKDDRFNQKMDKKTGFKTRNILCIAVRDNNNRVVAVIQAINRMRAKLFSYQDQYLMEAFATEIAAVLKRAALETALRDVLDESNVGENNFLAQFMKQSPVSSPKRPSSHVQGSLNATGSALAHATVEDFQFRPSNKLASSNAMSWDYDVLKLDENETLQCAVGILAYYELLDIFEVDPSRLRRFLLDVKAGYRNNPFHNFYHGIMVMQVSFTMFGTTDARSILSQTEMFALLVGALCHDVDHPGTNNAFEINVASKLAVLYNDSAVLENHHAATTFKITSNEESNIFANVDPTEFRSMRKNIILGILATDMTHHFDMIKEIQARCERSGLAFDPEVPADRQFVINTIVHCADLSNPALPDFSLVRKWAIKVCEEFATQRDMETERELPHSYPPDLRSIRGVAKLQLGFLDYIVGPLWKAMGDLWPPLRARFDAINTNRQLWQELADDEELEGVAVEVDVEYLESKSDDDVPEKSNTFTNIATIEEDSKTGE